MKQGAASLSEVLFIESHPSSLKAVLFVENRQSGKMYHDTSDVSKIGYFLIEGKISNDANDP